MRGCGRVLRGGWFKRVVLEVYSTRHWLFLLLYCGVGSVASYFITDDQMNSGQYQQTHLDVE